MSLERGFVTTQVVSPLSYVRWSDENERLVWFVYVYGVRTGSIQFGKSTILYRSALPREHGRMFMCFDDLRDELERIAALIASVNAHLIDDTRAVA